MVRELQQNLYRVQKSTDVRQHIDHEISPVSVAVLVDSMASRSVMSENSSSEVHATATKSIGTLNAEHWCKYSVWSCPSG